ncbi:MAG: sporulation protein YunB [Firmicutes bacterium]|nr:sporulation protein YunB [Bacillota bacterium]
MFKKKYLLNNCNDFCQVKPKKKWLTVKRKFIILLAILIAVIFAVAQYFEKHVNPIIIMHSSSRINQIAMRAVNSAVQNIVPTLFFYDSLVDISKDINGKITSITVNQAHVNQLGGEMVRHTQKELEFLSSNGINIPLGTFTGIPLLTGRGPIVNLRTLPIGSISASFASTFTTAGINQTRHQIKLIIHCTLTLILPTYSQRFEKAVEVLITESIIVGEVPNIYLNGNMNGSINLTP